MTWPATGFVTACGKQLEIACFGPPPDTAPTLVMLHEGLGCIALWRDLPQRLADLTGWGVCAYSRQGYGRSDPCTLPLPLDYMTREAVEGLPDVLAAIGFQSGALLGHSDGATIAAIHAAMCDTPLQALILIAPHFFTEPQGLAAIRAAREAYDAGDLRRRLALYHSHVDCAFRGWNESWLHPDFAQWRVDHLLSRITAPVLAVQGDADPYGTLAQIDALALCASSVERLIIRGVGHAPHVEAKETAPQAFADFLQKCAL